MTRLLFPVSLLLLILGSAFVHYRERPDFVLKNTDSDSVAFAKLYGSALVEGEAYDNLRYLCKNLPPRLSGSPGAAAAVEYTYQLLQSLNVDSVWKQPCMVPRWERGAKEQARIVDSKSAGNERMRICALGGSVATPEGGLIADVIEIRDFSQLELLGKKHIQGKIVFYNYSFKDELYSCFDQYGDAVKYRWAGPSMAEKMGAVGVLVRSMTNAIDTFPHTGVMRQDSLAAKIPAAAICTKDANRLSQLLKQEGRVQLYMNMNCKKYPDAPSFNVIGEIKGSEFPEEVIVFGGHLDAWDNGEGAHDDGAGIMQAIEILRLFKATGIRPKRTIRAVMWMNEENGGRGADAYANEAFRKNEKHIVAIESDAGGFSPRGFGMDMADEKKQKIQSWQKLFYSWGVYEFTRGGGGADIAPLKKLMGTPQIGLHPDSQRYFDYHHTANDIFENVNKRELHLGAGSMAALIFMIDKYGL